MTAATHALFKTLADPTRRSLLERLCREGEQTVWRLTRHARISQPAVSKHLASLKAAGLVRDRRAGRETHYRAEPQALAPLVEWMCLQRFLARPIRSAGGPAATDGSMMSELSPATRSIVVERILPHPPEKVWRALTESSPVTRPLAESMNATRAAVESNVDAFAVAGLTAAPSRKVRAPRVAESPVNLECVVTGIAALPMRPEMSSRPGLVLGEVVGVHIARRLLDAGVYVTSAAEPVLRGGGRTDYFGIDSSCLFKMMQPA